MIGKEDWVNIHTAYKNGTSIKEIARETGLARNTVRNAIRRGGVPGRSTKSKLDPYKEYLISRLAEYPALTVEKLLREIQAQGYGGGTSILAEFTAPYRSRRKEKSSIRFETPPGKQAQVDWAELGYHVIDGRKVKLSLFVIVLSFSRMLYARVVTDESLPTFLECHRHAFEYFGGVPEEILYDNAKVVALSRTKEVVVYNPGLVDFAGVYGFRPIVCKPYRPQTKGKVERSVKYIRDSFLEGEVFLSLDDMQQQLLRWLETVENSRVCFTTGEVPA
jgi:transposase